MFTICFKKINNLDDIILNNNSIPIHIENNLKWEYIQTNTSDLLIFDSYVPHRSSKNISNTSRSIFYFTYNKSIEGDFHTKYIENKRLYFPPPNERNNNQNIQITNNKYNLANPLV